MKEKNIYFTKFSSTKLNLSLYNDKDGFTKMDMGQTQMKVWERNTMHRDCGDVMSGTPNVISQLRDH